MGAVVPALYGSLVAATFISCVGLWYMKKWGFELYLVCFIGRTLFYLLSGQTGLQFYAGTGISLIFITILLWYYKRMSAEL